MSVRNLDTIRNWSTPEIPDLGARLYECLRDMVRQDAVLAQQVNGNLDGNPTAPPKPQALNVIPHPQGVQFAIQHEGNFYQGITYHIDATSKGVTHTYDVGASRNGVLPVGPLAASYQVRALYPSGLSSSPVVYGASSPKLVTGGTGSTDLMPGQGAGTTRASQPPGFGGTYRGSKPPVRSSSK